MSFEGMILSYSLSYFMLLLSLRTTVMPQKGMCSWLHFLKIFCQQQLTIKKVAQLLSKYSSFANSRYGKFCTFFLKWYPL